MKMLKIGGKITLEDNISYRILDKVSYRGESYLFCCTESKPIAPKVLHYKVEHRNIYVRVEENLLILLEISKKLVKK